MTFKEIAKNKKRKIKEYLDTYNRSKLLTDIKQLKTDLDKKKLSFDDMLRKKAAEKGDINIKNIQLVSKINQVMKINFNGKICNYEKSINRKYSFKADHRDEELKKALKSYLKLPANNKDNIDKLENVVIE